ncbi:MAG: hypothetical protein FWE94_08385 [Coriobacteriia bacterium]|nr:hypothetical protein [Coriobacteriia bacterium]
MSLLLTLVIEVPIVVIAGKGSKDAWATGVLVNMLTNPVAVLAVIVLAPFLWPGPASLVLVLAVEVAVVLAEWQVFRWALGWSTRKAFVVSLIANATSFCLGLLFSGGLWFLG